MTWIIDRIEEDIAVCEIDNGKTIDIPLSALPSGVKEGDAIALTIDDSEIKDRKENINKLMNDLFVD